MKRPIRPLWIPSSDASAMTIICGLIRTPCLKGGFGLVALSCAEHLLRPLMLPGPTATKPDRKVKVRFVPVPQEDDEGKHRVPAAFRSPDVAEAVIRAVM